MVVELPPADGAAAGAPPSQGQCLHIPPLPPGPLLATLPPLSQQRPEPRVGWALHQHHTLCPHLHSSVPTSGFGRDLPCWEQPCPSTCSDQTPCFPDDQRKTQKLKRSIGLITAFSPPYGTLWKRLASEPAGFALPLGCPAWLRRTVRFAPRSTASATGWTGAVGLSQMLLIFTGSPPHCRGGQLSSPGTERDENQHQGSQRVGQLTGEAQPPVGGETWSVKLLFDISCCVLNLTQGTAAGLRGAEAPAHTGPALTATPSVAPPGPASPPSSRPARQPAHTDPHCRFARSFPAGQ